MKIASFRNYLTYLTMVLLLVAVSCKEKNTTPTASMFSGETSKTWKATKETTATGQKDKIAGEEKNQVIQFFSNGSFSMRSSAENASGKWTFDPMSRNLTLQFVGSDMTENFQVLSVSEDEMKLQAGDGSQMTLESE